MTSGQLGSDCTWRPLQHLHHLRAKAADGRRETGHAQSFGIPHTGIKLLLVAPLQAIYLLTTGAREAAFRNIKTIAECLADELINAAKGSSNRCCMSRHTWHVHMQGLLVSSDTNAG